MEENRCRARSVIGEVEKSVVGKTDILRKVMTAILAGGHVLIEDIPGTVNRKNERTNRSGCQCRGIDPNAKRS